MEKRTHFYVSRKNWLTILMALLLVASAVARIAIIGLKGPDSSLIVWSQIILPLAATLLYLLITILNGEMQFYKTAIPVWMAAIYFALTVTQNYTFGPMINGLFWVALIFLAVLYTQITSGNAKLAWLLFLLLAAPLLNILYLHRAALLARDWKSAAVILPDVLMLLGMIAAVFAIRFHPAGVYYPTWGDRTDGRRIRSTPAMDQISPYLMVHRNESSNLFSESVEISNLERYVRRKRREGLTSFGMSHVIFAAYVRTVAKYPALNRFVAGQKVYSRGEDIVLCMTVKKEMSASSPDTVIKTHLHPRDTAEDVYNKFNAQVETAKNTPLDSGVDNTAGLMSLIPGVVLKFVVWLLKLLDYFGLLPGFLLEISPFHGSAYFTSMGSLGIRPVYHHLFDFGTIPVFCAFGRKRRAVEVQEDGTVVQKKYVDLKFTLDERICDGYYYASVIKHFVRILSHPEVLDKPAEVVTTDVP